MNNNIGGLVGFVAGTITGAFVGLLFAPDSGANTRKKLSYQLTNSKDRLQEVLEELRKKDKKNSLSESAQKNADLQEEAEKLLSEIEKLEAQVKKK